jgi:hypothetical protein
MPHSLVAITGYYVRGLLHFEPEVARCEPPPQAKLNRCRALLRQRDVATGAILHPERERGAPPRRAPPRPQQGQCVLAADLFSQAVENGRDGGVETAADRSWCVRRAAGCPNYYSPCRAPLAPPRHPRHPRRRRSWSSTISSNCRRQCRHCPRLRLRQSHSPAVLLARHVLCERRPRQTVSPAHTAPPRKPLRSRSHTRSRNGSSRWRHRHRT